MSEHGIIRDTQRYSIHDGPGIRTTVFFKGCPLRCAWCANPDTQRHRVEIAVDPKLCIESCGNCLDLCKKNALRKDASSRIAVNWPWCDGCAECYEECPSGAIVRIGRETKVDEVMALVIRDKPFYDSSGGGVTISGGEPLSQPHFLISLMEALRAEGIHIVLDTCGFAEPTLAQKTFRMANLIHYDLKIINSEEHLKWTGVDNSIIIGNFQRLADTDIPLQTRFPLIPGLTDSNRNLDEISTLLTDANVSCIDLLPFHRMGIRKYSLMGKKYTLKGLDVLPPSKEQIRDVVKFFAGRSIRTNVMA